MKQTFYGEKEDSKSIASQKRWNIKRSQTENGKKGLKPSDPPREVREGDNDCGGKRN